MIEWCLICHCFFVFLITQGICHCIYVAIDGLCITTFFFLLSFNKKIKKTLQFTIRFDLSPWTMRYNSDFHNNGKDNHYVDQIRLTPLMEGWMWVGKRNLLNKWIRLRLSHYVFSQVSTGYDPTHCHSEAQPNRNPSGCQPHPCVHIAILVNQSQFMIQIKSLHWDLTIISTANC